LSTPEHSRITIDLDGYETSFEWQAGETILEAGERADVSLAFSCREGHCGTCKARIVDGDVDHGERSALSKRDHEKRAVLLCQAIPLTATLKLTYD
jgi:ferredoxin